jgi:hypothetical protein
MPQFCTSPVPVNPFRRCNANMITAYSPFVPNDMFRRCVVCPDAFTGSCPACKDDEVCSLSVSGCDKCASTFCIKVAGTVTTTVSVVISATATSSATLPNQVSTSGTGTAAPLPSPRTARNRPPSSKGPVIGIIIGVFIFVAILLGLIFFAWRRRKRGNGKKEMMQRQSYVPAGGRYELDPSQIVRPQELVSDTQLHEIDGRERPIEVG